MPVKWSKALSPGKRLVTATGNPWPSSKSKAAADFQRYPPRCSPCDNGIDVSAERMLPRAGEGSLEVWQHGASLRKKFAKNIPDFGGRDCGSDP